MSNETWTIKRCLDWTREYLRDKGDERPRLSAEWLLSSVTGLSRTELYMSFDRPLASDELSAMHTFVVRRAKGEPLQYITGETDFRSITVACEPGVLIPRPETELLVEEVLTFLDREVLDNSAVSAHERRELPWNAEVEAARRAELASAAARAAAEAVGEGGENAAANDTDKAGDSIDGAVFAVQEMASAPSPTDAGVEAAEPRVARVLEVGCGTGCISLSLAHERVGRVMCVATDIEPRAVDLSTRNRDALGISPDMADFRLGNLVSPLDRETEWGTFDVMVSNPPYIPSKVMGELPREVSAFEPSLALDGGADGLDIFRRLVNAAPHMLRAGGLLACELYEGHLDAAADLCRGAGMHDVRVANDLTNRPRMIFARV